MSGLLLGALFMVPCSVSGQSPTACPPGLTALVLSGGGAKGLAHIGVIAALDSLGARPDLVVGTSIGAIVGALYAGGLSGRAIDSLARRLPRETFRAVEPRVPRGWAPLTPVVRWQQDERGFALQGLSVREAETVALLNSLLLEGNVLARGDFDSLVVSFRAVATDLATRQTVVLGSGDLARAVRASAAVPLLFSPEIIDGRVLADGGLSANVPLRVARNLGAARLIVSDVSSDFLTSAELNSPLVVADQLGRFLSKQPEDSLGPGDLRVRHDVKSFGRLDFAPKTVARVVDAGRRAADSVLGRAACLPRAAARSVAVPTIVGRVDGVGLRPSELRTLSQILGLKTGTTLEVEELRPRVGRLGEIDGFREVWLTPAGTDSVDFRLAVVRAPRRMLALDLAYDNELGGRLGAAALDRSLLGSTVEATAVLTVGQFVKDLHLGVRRYFGIGRSRVAPAVTARLSDLAVRLFTVEGVELPEADVREAAAFIGFERDFGSDWLLDVGLDTRAWEVEDEKGSTAGVTLRIARDVGSGPRVAIEGIWSGAYRRFHGEVGWRVLLGRVELSPRGHLAWGEDLPLHARFPLGGYDGFPGLHLEELRGDREALASLQASWRLRGPISLRFLVAAGRAADGGPLIGGGGWHAGARSGLGAETPLGPVIVEYGRATNGRGVAMIRAGRWF
ncbi:MAG TPA: patatin-like phospholipase family protein [Gemmatimonadales bacterium]